MRHRLIFLVMIAVLFPAMCFAEGTSPQKPAVAVLVGFTRQFQDADMQSYIFDQFKHNINQDNYVLALGESIQNKARFPLTAFPATGSLIAFGRENGYDFVIYVFLEVTNYKPDAGLTKTSVKQDIRVDGQFIDIVNEKRLLYKSVNSGGTDITSHILFFGEMPDDQKALKIAISRSVADLMKDNPIK
ncbi:MAG: hypothetical protein P4N41_15195 [Negativicutes bacterium]|nr:hypothetical protein [Negativicutes bacterium]